MTASIVYQQGAKYANGEFIQIHTIPGDDKLRLMSESDVVKVAVFGHTKMVNLVLLREISDYGNLVPRDIATREIFDVCINQKLYKWGKHGLP